MTDGTLHIEGTADLPDGALLSFEAKHEKWDSLDVSDPKKLVKESHRTLAEGMIPVRGGKYAREIDVSDWYPGAVEVWVSFQTILGEGKQPAAIIEQFGEMGERMLGSNVIRKPLGDGHFLKRVEITRVVRIPSRSRQR